MRAFDVVSASATSRHAVAHAVILPLPQDPATLNLRIQPPTATRDCPKVLIFSGEGWIRARSGSRPSATRSGPSLVETMCDSPVETMCDVVRERGDLSGQASIKRVSDRVTMVSASIRTLTLLGCASRATISGQMWRAETIRLDERQFLPQPLTLTRNTARRGVGDRLGRVLTVLCEGESIRRDGDEVVVRRSLGHHAKSGGGR